LRRLASSSVIEGSDGLTSLCDEGIESQNGFFLAVRSCRRSPAILILTKKRLTAPLQTRESVALALVVGP
jgi:hypothetical protein